MTMPVKRRTLIGTGLASALLAPMTGLARGWRQGDYPRRDILVLGGAGFIGPHMVSEALRRGHRVTLFNRGKTNGALFPDLETIVGDRDGGLDGLKGRRWDAVIDNSGYVPRHVRDSASLLAGASDHYLYISTISAYASLAEPLDESAPLATMDDPTIEEVTGETYGPLKALCEQRAAAAFGGDRLTILRPTYICGPGDRTDRFTYWPARTARGGQMLWPGAPEDAIQIIDVRDLAAFTVHVLEQRITGTYNTVTPAGSFTMGDLLADCLAVSAADTEPVWLPHDFIESQALGEGNHLPIWVPPLPEYAGAARVSGELAVAAGLRNRNTRETARDTLAWWKTLPADRTAIPRAGLPAEKEQTMLQAWRARVV
jgi:2'-hydroxyisoflavone reductase